MILPLSMQIGPTPLLLDGFMHTSPGVFSRPIAPRIGDRCRWHQCVNDFSISPTRMHVIADCPTSLATIVRSPVSQVHFHNLSILAVCHSAAGDRGEPVPPNPLIGRIPSDPIGAIVARADSPFRFPMPRRPSKERSGYLAGRAHKCPPLFPATLRLNRPENPSSRQH
jgi:hypothetical protein